MLQEIILKKLFNRFDYHIILSQSNITILTGPNGFGKSTILKIIRAISKMNLVYLHNLQFKEIKLVFHDEKVFTIKKDNTKLIIQNKIFEIEKFMSREYEWIIERSMSGIFYIDRLSWNELEQYTDLIINNSYFDYIDFLQESFKNYNMLKQLSELCGNIKFIAEQRYYVRKKDSEEQLIETISLLSESMSQYIKKLSLNYSQIANELDSTYPKRLFEATEELKNADEFTEKYKNINLKFKKLNKYHLVKLPISENLDYRPEFSKALKIYFDDFEKKYKMFEDFINKLDLFTEIINSRFKFKKISITQDNGFEIIDESQRKIKLEILSSGEKQELILFYNLLFESAQNDLLLIDEPEISLHIAWQLKFMEDLEKVIKLNNTKVIIATHSPQIINNRWDLQIDLGELYEQ